jgi:hypothetical protein
MANVKLIFHGTESSETDDHTLIAFANIHQQIYICIDMKSLPQSFICLDKPTAVRLVRELKKQIGYLESEVQNG